MFRTPVLYSGQYTSLSVLTKYLLTPWCRVLLEKLTGLQLVKKFPAFHGTRRFITALTRVRHLSLSWASPIQSIYPHPTSWRSVLILSTPLRLGLPSGLFPSGFPNKTLYTPPLLTHIFAFTKTVFIIQKFWPRTKVARTSSSSSIDSTTLGGTCSVRQFYSTLVYSQSSPSSQ